MMEGQTTRMILPGGGSFELPMPNTIKAMEGDGVSMLSSDSCPSVVLPVLVGLALGGLLTWAILAARR